MLKFIKTVLILIIAGAVVLFGINEYVKLSTSKNIVEKTEDFDADCILVLGCGIKADGNPSDMLYDRIKQGAELYNEGQAPKLLMSGDHGSAGYDEVNVMKKYAMDMGVPEEDIFMDHAGFSTYESLYRAKRIFMCQRIILVTQKYHLYRGLYIAKQLNIDAFGVGADYHTYRGQSVRDAREILARVKDFLTCIIKPQPKYLGEAIPVSGDGRVTDG